MLSSTYRPSPPRFRLSQLRQFTTLEVSVLIQAFASGIRCNYKPDGEEAADTSVRYQQGHLRCVGRKNGPPRWEFMWREQQASGKPKRRTAVIGTTEQYPTEESAQEAVRGLRMQINEARNRQPHQSICVADLIEHFFSTELTADRHSHATRMVYREFLIRWIKPHWGLVNIGDVRTVAVEGWLRKLRRQDGDDLANSTKAKIRSVMSVLFNHAIRMSGSSKEETRSRLSARVRNKRTLQQCWNQEIQSLLAELEQPFRLMVLLDVTTGLRRSELFALKWSDIDFWNLVIEVCRSICEGVVGNCKTEASRSPIPLSLDVAVDLWLWKESTNYAASDDWVFASPRLKGKSSRRPDVVLTKVIQPAAVRAGIKKKGRFAYISAHVFNNTHREW